MNIRSELAEVFRPQDSTPEIEGEEKVTVSPATKRLAHTYERFRNTLEPDEADILRRNAIYRSLERRLNEGKPPQQAAEALLQELIRANYIKPVTKAFASRIAHILFRAQGVRNRLNGDIGSWFLRLVAVAIDRQLFPRYQQEGLVKLMYADSYRRAEWTDDLVDAQERAIQLYIGCHRALFEADDFELSYHYFLYFYPLWNGENFNEEEADKIAGQLHEFYDKMQDYINHPARDRMIRLLKPTAVPYRIIYDMGRNDDLLKITADDGLNQAARDAVGGRAKRIRGRMNRRAWHSILFLFFTKTIIAFVVELPYELFLLGEFYLVALIVNVTFHPILLFLLATTVQMPGLRNTDRMVEHINKIVTGKGELPTIIMKKTRRYGAVTWSFFAMVYATLFLGIFWGMFTFLDYLKFSLVAMFIFVMFLGLVSFLATRIRRSVDDLRVLPKREGAIGVIFTFLSLPVLEFGRWLAKHISQVNIFLIFMDRVLEAPFKFFIDVVEEWFSFVRDRREEIS